MADVTLRERDPPCVKVEDPSANGADEVSLKDAAGPPSPANDFRRAVAAAAEGMPAVEAARALVATMTPEEKLWCLDGDRPTLLGLGDLFDDGYHKAPFVAARVERVGLVGVVFCDGPRGVVVGDATCFPVTMARGATWDPELEERVGAAIGSELRAVGADLSGAVCVNLLRHPAWGRAQETYGEDPFHVGEMGAALTRGLQRHVMACVKHLACNSMENARFSVDIDVDEVALHEVYLPHFKRIVEEGVASIMTAYNAVNGEWCGQNRALLADVVRGEWGFEGFVISDFVFGLRDAAASLAAGLDVEMPFRMLRARDLGDALDRGEASWADVDAAVERLVATLVRFDAVVTGTVEPGPDADAHRLLAREVAARSVVLLRNQPVDGAAVLPLPTGGKVAVLGPLADVVNIGDGGSSDVWDLDCTTLREGIAAVAREVVHDDGADPERAAGLAATCDAAVVVVGYTFRDEGEFVGSSNPAFAGLFPEQDEPEVADRFMAQLAARVPVTRPERLAGRERGLSEGGDRSSLRLADEQVALVRAVAAANPRTIVVIQAGSAVVATEWIDAVPAVVQAWYGGREAGPGLADVLFGAVNPSARLPFSVPADEADLPAFDRDATSFRYDRWHGWWHLARHGTTPAFPFGFGLSYTSFVTEDVDVALEAGADAAAGGSIRVQGTVRNTGPRDGAQVVQVYAELPDPDAPARLVGFARVEVPAGGSTPFEVVVPADRLATRDAEAHRWRPPTGAHRIVVARHAADPDPHSMVVTLDEPPD
jgi:beta-glucosidase-like glycosyl hydrolase